MAVQYETSVGVGGVLPALTLQSLDGGEVGLDAYRGKQLVLFMWASW